MYQKIFHYNIPILYDIIGLLNWYWWIFARVGCKNARAYHIAKTFFCLFTRIFSQVYFKFLRRMMILHLASKCAILATALLLSSICCWLHETFLWESTKNYGQFDKSLLIQLVFTVIDENHCFFRILTTAFQHPPLFLFTTVRSILHAQFGTFRGALYYMI